MTITDYRKSQASRRS